MHGMGRAVDEVAYFILGVYSRLAETGVIMRILTLPCCWRLAAPSLASRSPSQATMTVAPMLRCSEITHGETTAHRCRPCQSSTMLD